MAPARRGSTGRSTCSPPRPIPRSPIARVPLRRIISCGLATTGTTHERKELGEAAGALEGLCRAHRGGGDGGDGRGGGGGGRRPTPVWTKTAAAAAPPGGGPRRGKAPGPTPPP